ncbi:HAD-IC family P-type ATPase [Inmirania thermothiophila]|uniref:P-type E1-E2 ATPase n=1 Tax=Inmirania thermothiophila TaxID=1750597 RepID=A0A3N1Y1H8_9GAMM|nr:HAD-IC family P-type ATPase [Inmirania thermothiophila]ROR32675.1 P-type E1-E2 ATPase [Inmirania thermothiophila]
MPREGAAPQWHALAAAEVLARLASGPDGLGAAEAAARLARHGPNRLPPPPRDGPLRRFLRQFESVYIHVLLAAAAVTAALGLWLDAGVILGVVLVNALIGFIQEGRAEDAMEAIRRVLAPRATVVRDGRLAEVDAAGLVPGDVVVLAAGDRVPADLRLLEAHALAVDEAALTGESVPVEKAVAAVAPQSPLAERRSMAWAGTMVRRGQGRGVVVATGPGTEIGRISGMVAQRPPLASPLLARLARLARWVTALTLLLAAAGFAAGVLWHGADAAHMFLASVALAVAAIPEGLPAIVTITLAVGVQRMARRNAVIRRLPAVETLGAVTVICTDKTGTLTRGEMTVVEVVTASGVHRVAGAGYEPRGAVVPPADAALTALAGACALAADAHVEPGPDGWRAAGDPVDAALHVLARKLGLDPAALAVSAPRIAALPFDPARRFTASLHREAAGRRLLCLKGAPEAVLARCARVRTARGEAPLEAAAWRARAEAMARAGRRVLAVAERRVEDGAGGPLEALAGDGLTLLGLVGIMDPPRPEAAPAVAQARRAGIAVKLVTGDHPGTAAAVARAVGIARPEPVRTGGELATLDERGWREAAAGCDVFARTSPEQKLRLVEALDGLGAVVAMTGDGVNDAPALRRAHVGVAMGRGGTEAAREAAEVVLADDHFATIVAAVEEGRVVDDNVRKALLFVLPTNGAEALAVWIGMVTGLPLPVTPLQILWINMVTAVTLALALAFEAPEPDVMARPPRPPRAGLLSPLLAWRVALVSVLGAGAVYLAYELVAPRGEAAARTAAANTLVLAEAAYLFTTRRVLAPLWRGPPLRANPWVARAVAAVLALQLLFTHAPPLQALFGTAALGPGAWGLAAALGLAVAAAAELDKAAWRRLGR